MVDSKKVLPEAVLLTLPVPYHTIDLTTINVLGVIPYSVGVYRMLVN